MNITIDKDDYIVGLKKALRDFYEVKAIGDKEQIKYFQGLSKEIVLVLRKLGIVSVNKFEEIVKDSPAIFRTNSLN